MNIKAILFVAVTLASVGAFIPSGKRHTVTAHTDTWYGRYYAIPNECDQDATCYGGGTYATPEAALNEVADDMERTCLQYPNAAIIIPFVSGPPGSDYTRSGVKTKGLVEELISRGVDCAIQVETRPDVMGLVGRPERASLTQTALQTRYNFAMQGCAHGTISHNHSNEVGDRECGWPSVGVCADTKQWCRCYGTDGQLDPDGTCVNALDAEDCGASTCTILHGADYIKSAPDAQILSYLDDYQQIVTVGRQRDEFCDDIPNRVREDDCGDPTDPSTENNVPAGQRAWPYVYREYFEFDFGASVQTRSSWGFSTSISDPKYTTGADATHATVSGANWTPHQWAGGTAYIRFNSGSLTWERRTIVDNTADTIEISSAWQTIPVSGTIIGIDAAGNSPKIRADVSGVIVDLEDENARALQAALPYAIAYDLGIPQNKPLVAGLQSKFGMWIVAGPDNAVVNAPCRTPDNLFSGINRFQYPTPSEGDGKCEVTLSHAFGNPWPTKLQYETLWNDVAERILATAENGYFTNAKMATVAAPGANRFGQTVGGAGLWEGLSASVQSNTRFAGSRYKQITPDGSFPFNVPACQDGLDNDSDGLIDLNDAGCANASDTSEVDAPTACNDGVDNDSDGAIDYSADTGCSSTIDTSERGTIFCDDGQDNDGDGLIDFPADALGCTGIGDTDETDPVVAVACNDGVDNDGDGSTDFGAGRLNDPGCTGATDPDETKSDVQCDDGINNDSDGAFGAFIDLEDPGCSSSTDNSEDGFGSTAQYFYVWARNLYYIADRATRNAAFNFLMTVPQVPGGVSEISDNLYLGDSAEEIWANAGDTNRRYHKYDSNHFFCIYNGCGYEGTLQDTGSIPEDVFLHVQEDTQIHTNNALVPDVTITGCPVGTPKTSACRAVMNGWDEGLYYIYNQNSLAYRTYYESRMKNSLLNAGGRGTKRIQGIFWDAQGENWGNNYNGNSNYQIMYGGQIRSDEVPGSPRYAVCQGTTDGACDAYPTPDCGEYALPGYPSSDGCSTHVFKAARDQWMDSYTANTAYFRDVAAKMGAFVMTNCAGWSLDPRCNERISASSGAHPEQIPYASMSYEQLEKMATQLRAVISHPHGTYDFFSNGSTEEYPPGVAANPHHYLTGRGRVQMTRYALYLTIREELGYPGKSYFDPTETVNVNCVGAACLDFETFFFPGLVDLGWPTASDYSVIQTGINPPGTCGVYSDVPYRIYERTYANGVRVITRPIGGWQCRHESNALFDASTEVTVPLGGNYSVLREDGTLGPVINTLSLYSAEGVILYPANPNPNLVADLNAEYMQGVSSCIAPCPIHVDLTGTIDPTVSSTYSDLVYETDCGPGATGTYADGSLRRYQYGPITGCVFETDGVQTITSTVRNLASGEVDTDTATITVSPITSQFTGANIHCFSNDTDQSGCPTGGTTHNNITTMAQIWAACPAASQKRACLLHRGDSFTGNGVSLTNTSVGTIGIVGAYGSGADPVITGTTSGFTLAANWVLANLNITFNNAGSLLGNVGGDRDRMVAHELVATNVYGCYNVATGSTGTRFNTRVALIDVSCQRSPTAPGPGEPGNTGTLFFERSELSMFHGGVWDANCRGEFVFRTVGLVKASLQHITMRRPGQCTNGTRNVIQLRTWAQSNNSENPTGSGPAVRPNRYLNVSDNILEWNTNNVIRICENNDCTDIAGGTGAGAPQQVSDILIERNFVRHNPEYSAGVPNLTGSGFVHGQVDRLTVRNNILDLQGLGAGNVNIAQDIVPYTDCVGCTSGNWIVSGNTVYWDDDLNLPIDFCIGRSGVTYKACENNLVYRPQDATVAGDSFVSSGTWTNSVGNLFTGAVNPFVGAIPADGLSDALDFQLSGGSAARNQGTPGGRLDRDFCFAPRPFSTSHDAGAWEQGATCP